MELIIIGKKGSNPNVSFSELKGKLVGIVSEYAYLDNLNDDKNINFVYGKSDQENLENLLSNKIDFMMVDNLLIQYLLNHELSNLSNTLEIGSVTLITKPLYFALSKKTPNAEKIIKGFNEQIKKMIADGTYNKLLELNWIVADVDGDGTFELVFNSSSTIPCACSIHLSQTCALIPAINKLVSGFFLPQNEHSNTSLAIFYRFI